MNLSVPRRRHFPDPRAAGPEGLLMVGGRLTPEMLLEAYGHGIFPWPQEGYPMLWFSPPQRGVLDFNELHIPRSFAKFVRNAKLKVTFNRAFARVISGCAQARRPGQSGTWITPEIEQAYMEFHRLGHAHSVECWNGEELVGGLYGTWVAGVFSAESMFYKQPNASKLCLLKLIEKLRDQGITWLDTQMVTEGVRSFGGKYISRDEFLARLERAKKFAATVKI